MKFAYIWNADSNKLEEDIKRNFKESVEILKDFIKQKSEAEIPGILICELLKKSLVEAQEKLTKYLFQLISKNNALEEIFEMSINLGSPKSLNYLSQRLKQRVYKEQHEFENFLYEMLNKPEIIGSSLSIFGHIQSDGGKNFETVFDMLDNRLQSKLVLDLPFDAFKGIAIFGDFSLLKKFLDLLPPDRRNIVLQYNNYEIISQSLIGNRSAVRLIENIDVNEDIKKFKYLFDLIDNEQDRKELLIVFFNNAIRHDNKQSDKLNFLLKKLQSNNLNHNQLAAIFRLNNYEIIRSTITWDIAALERVCSFLSEEETLFLYKIACTHFSIGHQYLLLEYDFLYLTIHDAIEKQLNDQEIEDLAQQAFDGIDWKDENIKVKINDLMGKRDFLIRCLAVDYENFSKTHELSSFLNYINVFLVKKGEMTGSIYKREFHILNADVFDEKNIKLKIQEILSTQDKDKLWETIKKLSMLDNSLGNIINTQFLPHRFARPSMAELEEDVSALAHIQSNPQDKQLITILKHYQATKNAPSLWVNNLDIIHSSKKNYKKLYIDGNEIHKQLREIVKSASAIYKPQKTTNYVAANIGFVVSTKPVYFTKGQKYVSNIRQFITIPIKLKENVTYVADFFNPNYESKETFGNTLFWKHYQRDKSKAHNLLNDQNQINEEKDKREVNLFHSEEALFEALEMSKELLDYIQHVLQKKGLKEGHKLYDIIIDLHSIKQVCSNCQKRILGAQNSEENGFLKIFRERFADYFIFPEKNLRIVTRTSADKILKPKDKTKEYSIEPIAGISPDIDEIAHKAKFVEIPAKDISTKIDQAHEEFIANLKNKEKKNPYYPFDHDKIASLYKLNDKPTTGTYLPCITSKINDPIDIKQLENRVILAAPIKITEKDLANGKPQENYSIFASGSRKKGNQHNTALPFHEKESNSRKRKSSNLSQAPSAKLSCQTKIDNFFK